MSDGDPWCVPGWEKQKKAKMMIPMGGGSIRLFLFTYLHRLLAVKVSQNLRMVHGVGSISRPHFFHSFQ